MYFVLGGDKYGGETGFLGCMRNLYVQGFRVLESRVMLNIGGVVNGSCELQDRLTAFLVCLTVAIVLVISALIARVVNNTV